MNKKFIEDNKISEDIYCKLIKQKSELGIDLQHKVPVTGSTMYYALGLSTLSKQRQIFDEKNNKVPCVKPSAEQKKIMDYSCANEIYAIGTLVGKVMPIHCSQDKFY